MNEINETEEMDVQYQVGIARPWYKRRWWMRQRQIVSVHTSQGWTGGAELYVPFWARPFELIHRAVFGAVKISS